MSRRNGFVMGGIKSTEIAVNLVADCGGSVAGPKHIQLIGCLFELAGLEDGIRFDKRSEVLWCGKLAIGVHVAIQQGMLKDYVESRFIYDDWEWIFRPYELNGEFKSTHPLSKQRQGLASIVKDVDAPTLEVFVRLMMSWRHGNGWRGDEAVMVVPSFESKRENWVLIAELYSKLLCADVPIPFPKVHEIFAMCHHSRAAGWANFGHDRCRDYLKNKEIE